MKLSLLNIKMHVYLQLIGMDENLRFMHMPSHDKSPIEYITNITKNVFVNWYVSFYFYFIPDGPSEMVKQFLLRMNASTENFINPIFH